MIEMASIEGSSLFSYTFFYFSASSFVSCIAWNSRCLSVVARWQKGWYSFGGVGVRFLAAALSRGSWRRVERAQGCVEDGFCSWSSELNCTTLPSIIDVRQLQSLIFVTAFPSRQHIAHTQSPNLGIRNQAPSGTHQRQWLTDFSLLAW